MILSKRRLRRWFRHYNRAYFGGRLPRNAELSWTPIEQCWGQCCGEPPEIQLSPACGVDSRLARMTLLHEMVHLSLYPYLAHGPRFEAEMQRLAIAGAMKGLW